MTTHNPSYLIVGAGVFGVSTAYHLIQKYPNASVTLVDRDAYDAESRVAASWDWNKVVRADYDDKVYCQLALEAQDIFKSDPLWKPHFHQTGVYWTCRSSYAQNVITNHKELGRNDDIIALPVAEARKLYGGIFDNADYTGVKEVLINRASGWAAAGDALRAVTKKCLELGVKYVTADIATLQFDGRGSCTGVKTKSGQTLSATHVIVAAGAFTPTLLEWSAAASGNPGLRAEERILAAGITTGMAQLNEEQYEKFKDMPVGFQGYTPNEDKHLTLNRDAFTTTSDFIISPHSASKGLYIATCGSFHGFKFFPVLGKYVVQMLEGELAPELIERWAWDRQRPDSSQNVEALPSYPSFYPPYFHIQQVIWLLNARTVTLEDFFESQAPSYAILSHTWGAEEVSFQDIQERQEVCKKKKGYQKIIHTCRQALKDGLEYAWVDTCCIDKSSSSELSEAINSMFRWYGKAAVCYAFLADVLPGCDPRDTQGPFATSRWFTRGWTLQELLAPENIVFYASDWSQIASKTELRKELNLITGVDVRYLSSGTARHVTIDSPSRFGKPPGSVSDSTRRKLHQASVAERMSWASSRQTTRTEDLAYCLLGIFGISMPLIYGEGERAFVRLQEEIIKSSNDQSILAWGYLEPWKSREDNQSELYAQVRVNEKRMGVLAHSPAAFRGCGSIIPSLVDKGNSLPLSVTNKGLHICLPVSDGEFPVALLRCRPVDNPTIVLAVNVKHVQGNIYSRADDMIEWVDHRTWSRWPRKEIYLSLDEHLEEELHESEFSYPGSSIFIRHVPDTFSVQELSPYTRDMATSIFPPNYKTISPGLSPCTGNIALLFTSKQDSRKLANFFHRAHSIFITQILTSPSDAQRMGDSVHHSRHGLQSCLHRDELDVSKITTIRPANIFALMSNFMEVYLGLVLSSYLNDWSKLHNMIDEPIRLRYDLHDHTSSSSNGMTDNTLVNTNCTVKIPLGY
ncbi:unnamed protein product [Aspergillus oryzae]|nr:unnamed protein product [Aspergillus oryzae]